MRTHDRRRIDDGTGGSAQTDVGESEKEGGIPTWLIVLAAVVALIFALVRSDRGAIAAPTVGAYIGAAYWFTSSTSFANPAVTIGRVFSDTFAGIAPGSAPTFIGMQLVGMVVGVAVTLALYPDAGVKADDVVVPHRH